MRLTISSTFGAAWALIATTTCAGVAGATGVPWLSVGLLGGSTRAVGSLSDYQWKIGARPAYGAEAFASTGRFGVGLRAWTASSVQTVDVAGTPMAPEVRWTSLALVGRTRLVSMLGCEARAGLSAGRMRLAYRPDAVTIDAGGTPTTVNFDAVDEWIGGGELGLARALGSHWRVGMDLERRLFALDTAHRNGSVIEYARQSFGDWSARLGVERSLGLR